jgi:hypothetical protein
MIQMRRLTTVLLLALLLLLGLLTATATPAAAIPPETGCPSAFQVLVVEELLAQGYVAPATVDQNGNGLVCGVPLPEQVCGPDCPVPVLYNFLDDDLAQR